MMYYIDYEGGIEKVNIKTYCIDYLGAKQGYKVFINGSKYPKKYNHYYTSMYKDNCIKYAIKDYIKNKEVK